MGSHLFPLCLVCIFMFCFLFTQLSLATTYTLFLLLQFSFIFNATELYVIRSSICRWFQLSYLFPSPFFALRFCSKTHTHSYQHNQLRRLPCIMKVSLAISVNQPTFLPYNQDLRWECSVRNVCFNWQLAFPYRVDLKNASYFLFVELFVV